MSIVTLDQDRVFWPRFQIGSYFGVPEQIGKSLNMTARQAYATADRLQGSTPLANGLFAMRMYGDRSGKDQYGENDSDTTAIGPTFFLPEDTDFIQFNNTLVEDTEDQRVYLPNPFRTGYGASHINAEPNSAVIYTSVKKLGYNRAFYLRIGIPDWDDSTYKEEDENGEEQEKSQKYQSLKQGFGDGKPFRFILEFWSSKGSGSGRKIWLHRLAPDWTDELQKTLEETRQSLEELNKTGSVEEVALVEESIFQQQRKIYCQTDDLSSEFNMIKVNHFDYGEYVFIPIGQKEMFVRGEHVSKETTLKINPNRKEKDIVKQYYKDQMWESTPIVISCNGGVFIWQNGRVMFNRNSRTSLPEKFRGDARIDGHFFLCGPGADIIFSMNPPSLEEEDQEEDDDDLTIDEYYAKYGFMPPDEYSDVPEVNLPTINFISDGNYPALLYDFNTWQDALEPATELSSALPSLVGGENGEQPRAGGFDSDDHKVIDVAAPIEDVKVSYDGLHGKTTLTVTVLTANEVLSLDGGPYQKMFHDRMSKFSSSRQTILDYGLISKAVGSNRTSGRIDQLSRFTTGPNSKVTFTVHDLWHLAEEWLITEDPILDGMKLGYAIRLLLKLMGTRDWQMAGIPPNYGPRLPKSPVGKGSSERPAYDNNVAETLRQLMERYDPNGILDPKSGVWTIRQKDTTIKAVFCRDPIPNQNPPQFRILTPFDLIRDFSDMKNMENLVGGKDEYGNQITAYYKTRDSMFKEDSPQYVGRVKRAKTVKDEGKTTIGSAMSTVRGTAIKSSRPGDFFRFGTDTILNLYAGHRVMVENNYCEIESTSDGSIAYGKQMMELLTRDLRYIATPIVIEG
jgi:hypothetical protein